MRAIHPLVSLVASVGGLLGFSLISRSFDATNPTTAALGLLVIVLVTATISRLWVAVSSSVAAMLCLNFFFVPPVGTFTVADAHNWVSLAAFVVVGVVASRLSATAQARTREAEERRNELGRLFDLGRDMLLTEDGRTLLAQVARHIARRFALDEVALCLPAKEGGWHVHQGGARPISVSEDPLNAAFARAGAILEFDARDRAYGGQATVEVGGRTVRVVPFRLGTQPVGLLVAPAALEPGTADAIAGLVAIAVERSQLLGERREAELVRQKADLASTLLASMSHDLRTPLTAIGVAVDNLDDSGLPAEQRASQVRLARSELQRLNRLFRDILDMARIDAEVLPVAREWVTAADIVDAAFSNLRPELDQREVTVEADETRAVLVDPRLTSAALSHLLENALQYAPAGKPIEVRGWTNVDGLHLSVRDHGAGLDAEELSHLFDRFYRGRHGRATTTGSGMGLAITRGLLAVEQGRVWGENAVDGGALFTMVVPAARRDLALEE